MAEVLVAAAEALARKAHAGQFRRDGVTPYIVHPAAVATRVRHVSPSAQAVAWLHDVLEDTTLTRADLEAAGMPCDVLDAVELLTKRAGQPYEAYLDAVAAHPLARVVKIADMLSNLGDTPTEAQVAKYTAGLLRLTEPMLRRVQNAE